jgi:hypothetical protein
MPLRVSALRSLGAYMNIFSIESFMDELAQARAADPVEFRLQHLDDPVARRCLNSLPLCTGAPYLFAQACQAKPALQARRLDDRSYGQISAELSTEPSCGGS